MRRSPWLALFVVGCGHPDAPLTPLPDGGARPGPVVLVDFGFEGTADAAQPADAAPRPAGPPPIVAGRFVPGAPAAVELFVDPEAGDDGADGRTRETAMRTLEAVFARASTGDLATSAVRLRLGPGTLPAARLSGRRGTRETPLFVEGEATLAGPIELDEVRDVYVDGLALVADGTPAITCRGCEEVLLRGLRVDHRGDGPAVEVARSLDVFAEDLDVRSSGGIGLDWIANRHGHIVGNRVTGAGTGIRVRAGSAFLRVEGNDVVGGVAGYAVGPASDVSEMASPFIHYEAYGVRFVNNLGRSLAGSAATVHGGYDVLVAYNTFHTVAAGAALFEIGPAGRACARVTDCASHEAAGGLVAPVPSRHVFVFDNLVLDPPSAGAVAAHLKVEAPDDADVQFQGNVVAAAPEVPVLALDGPPSAAEVAARNAINTVRPVLADPEAGDLRLGETGWLASVVTYPPPPFVWDDRPARPPVPEGDTDNAVPRTRSGSARPTRGNPGAY
jgi:hypothetical protein